MNAEFLRFALEHRRKLREGLCRLHHGVRLDQIGLTPDQAAQLQFDALRLMAVSGLSLEESRSAVVSWILHGAAGQLPKNWAARLPGFQTSSRRD